MKHLYNFKPKKKKMRIRRIRFRKEFRTKGRIIIFLLLTTGVLFVPYSNRALMASYFSTKCRSDQPVFSKRLNDRIVDYGAAAAAKGIEKCSDAGDIAKRVLTGQLSRVKGSRFYKIQNMTHSYPYLTHDSKKLLREIGKRFNEKVGKEGFKGTRFIITSMTRTSEKVSGLGKTNLNASANSPHLNGNAFDISYARFSLIKYTTTECDEWYLKEALAEVIWKLKEEKQCWATYEKQQGCFHVVSR